MVKLNSDYQVFIQQTDRLMNLLSNIHSLSPQYSKLIGEIIMLRLFDMLEQIFKSIAVKLICGACYIDGTMPTLYTRARSAVGAETQIISYGRIKPRHRVNWTQVKEIKDNLEYVFDSREKYIRKLDENSAFIEEMRWIRNRIAHNNKKSRENYKKAVIRHYGAFVTSITPGIILLSNRNKPTLLEQYILKSRILLKEMIKG